MKEKGLKKLGLNFEKMTISKLKQKTIEGGGWSLSILTENTCHCTFCEFDDC
ncbi:hypothetical protein [uncultured Dokdonia sp.]|uniref:hypothetical protein n=1 Tax=uncultured Dokdonia sp. TaxID=575653 RepID=UPI002621B0CA|nr:hypothetical protein [uncultured Dokdonia sp.]